MSHLHIVEIFLLIWQALASVVIMFGIQWGYALCNFLAFLMIYIYIGQFNPGVFPGMCLLMLKELQKTAVFVYIFNVDFKND